MKKLLFSLIVCLFTLTAFAAKKYDVNSTASISSLTPCQGDAATISFVYNTCNSGSGATTATTMTVTWYSNTSGVATTTGSTIVSGPTTGVTISTAATGTLTYSPSTASTGTIYYFCRITASTGSCGATTFYSSVSTVTVSAYPSAIGGSTALCTGSSYSFTEASSGGTWATSAGGVASISATTGSPINVTGVSAGSATISYTNAAGCTVTKAVTVTTTPSAIGGATTVCHGATTSYTDASSGGTWATSAGTIASISATSGSPITVSGVNVGTATISYTSAGGCTVTKNISVNGPGPITGTLSVCAGGSVTTLADTSTGGSWSSVTTSVATVDASGNVTSVASGTSVISYTVSGCAAVATVTVNPGPAAISPSGTVNVCTGSVVALSDATGGGTWSSSSTSLATVDASGNVYGVATGSVTISYTTAGCTPVTQVVTVNGPAPITGTASVCVGSSTALADATGSGSWSSGATSIATVDGSGNVYGVSGGSATISYTVSGCSATVAVAVSSAPTSISPSSPSVCVGGTATLTDGTSGGTWSSAATSTATVVAGTGVVSGVAAGSVNITYTIAGCTPVTTSLTVQAALPAITGTTTICAGTTSTLADGTSGGSWSSSATSIATVVSGTGVVSAVAAGSATITYTQGACKVTAAFTVSTTPSAISGASSVCAPILTTILTEDWESGAPTAAGSPVDGWTYIGGTSGYWFGTTYGADPSCSPESGSNMAEFNSYSISSGNATLCSPSMSLSGVTGATVTFWVYRDYGSYYTGSSYATEAITISVNTSASTTGATVLGVVPRDAQTAITTTHMSGTSTTTSSGWYQYTATIPASFTGTTYILFKGKSCLMISLE